MKYNRALLLYLITSANCNLSSSTSLIFSSTVNPSNYLNIVFKEKDEFATKIG